MPPIPSLSTPVREPFPLLPAGTAELMYLLLAGFTVIFLYGLYQRFKPYGVRNLLAELASDPSARLGQLVRFALFQRKVLSRSMGGVLHFGLFFGGLVLFVGTSLVFIDYGILRVADLSLLRGYFYLVFEVSLDAFGIVFLAGVVLAILRRLIARPTYLENRTGYFFVLVALLYIGATGFLLEGLRLSLKPVEWQGWSFVGSWTAQLLSSVELGGGTGLQLYQALWWSHALTTFALVALLPYSNLLHVLTSSLNAMIAAPSPQGALSTPFDLQELMATGSFEVKVGSEVVGDYSWRQRLALDACTNCGRCEAICPATAAGTPLSPRQMVQHLKGELELSYSHGSHTMRALVPAVVTEGEIWACTLCGACVQACPVLINPVEYIVEVRRSEVAKGRFNKKKSTLLANLANMGNPYGLPITDRAEVVAALRLPTLQENPHAEYLYWMGCMAIYDPRSREIAKAVVKILRAANVSFAVLGSEERCNGDPARRLGEEGRFQELALRNIQTLNEYKVKKIIASCPHCFNTLKNEYCDLGGQFEVIHHSELITQLIASGSLKLRDGVGLSVTMHDACYAGRFNNIIDPPRRILNAVRGMKLVEMPRCRENSFCCGAGGANYWYTVPQKEKINVIRVKEAAATGAQILAAECPFCVQMFGEAVKTAGLEGRLSPRDIAEIVADTL